MFFFAKNTSPLSPFFLLGKIGVVFEKYWEGITFDAKIKIKHIRKLAEEYVELIIERENQYNFVFWLDYFDEEDICSFASVI